MSSCGRRRCQHAGSLASFIRSEGSRVRRFLTRSAPRLCLMVRLRRSRELAEQILAPYRDARTMNFYHPVGAWPGTVAADKPVPPEPPDADAPGGRSDSGLVTGQPLIAPASACQGYVLPHRSPDVLTLGMVLLLLGSLCMVILRPQLRRAVYPASSWSPAGCSTTTVMIRPSLWRTPFERAVRSACQFGPRLQPQLWRPEQGSGWHVRGLAYTLDQPHPGAWGSVCGVNGQSLVGRCA